MSESHDHEHSVEDIKKHVRRYLLIGVALAIGTVLTVWASFIDFGKFFGHPGAVEYNVTVALIIASAKGFLVAGFFMHLLSEKKMIYSVLITTLVFFIALMFLTLWSMQPSNLIQIHG
jgi:cytochrome c oxidase subunit IV